MLAATWARMAPVTERPTKASRTSPTSFSRVWTMRLSARMPKRAWPYKAPCHAKYAAISGRSNRATLSTSAADGIPSKRASAGAPKRPPSMHARAVLLHGDKLLRIGITLRSLPTLGGPGTYTEQLVRRLLQIDRKKRVRLDLSPATHGNVACTGRSGLPERARGGDRGDKSGLIWDQITVPLVAQRNDVDLLFRPFQQMPSWGGFKKGHGHPWR